jgi:hypothetical protein
LTSDLSPFSETIENNTFKTSKLLGHGNNIHAKFINKINNIVFQAKKNISKNHMLKNKSIFYNLISFKTTIAIFEKIRFGH